jgi:hypothetical protein
LEKVMLTRDEDTKELEVSSVIPPVKCKFSPNIVAIVFDGIMQLDGRSARRRKARLEQVLPSA